MFFRNLLFSFIVLAWAGCASPPSQVRIQIAGGERIIVDLRSGRVIGASYDDFKVRMGGMVPNAKEKLALLTYVIEFKPGETPRSIKIEDLSDQKPQLMHEDLNPKIGASLWAWNSVPMKTDHNDLRWLHEIDDSFRVSRITVVMADGRQCVQVLAYLYPAFIKAKFRRDLGIDP